MTDISNAGEDGSLEGPDIEVSADDRNATKKPGGLGPDGTIPDAPDGIAAGLTDSTSHFNAEEDRPEN